MGDLGYPSGRRERVAPLAPAQRHEGIEKIAAAPAQLRRAVAGLDDRQLDTPYRPDGWTVRQVVHHVPDSHLNAYVRFKLGLTEDQPAIRTYEEKLWAETPEMRAPIDVSLPLLEGLHGRWVLLLRALEPAHFARTIQHPELGRGTLDGILPPYAWHRRRHTAPITTPP